MGYTLNPAVISGNMPSMPQISSGATTAYTGINTAPLPSVSSVGGDSSTGGLLGMAQDKFSDILSFFGSLLGMAHEDIAAKKQRKYNSEQADLAYQRSIDMWNMTNEYNSPAEQLKRLRDAGLNPLYFGLDGTSANAFEAQQPLGYERSSGSGVFNPLASTLELNLKNRLADAQIKNMEAQTNNIEANTDQTYLETKFLEDTLAIREEAETVKVEYNRAQIEQVKELTRKASAEINKIAVEMDTELAKQILYHTEAALKDGELHRLKVLLPLEANLMRAKTDTEKAQASWFAVQTSVEQFKLDSKYYDTIIDKAKSEASSAEAKAALEQFRVSVRSGDANKLGKWFNDHPNWKAAFPALGFLSSDLFKLSAMLDDSGIYKAVGVGVGAATIAGRSTSKSPSAGQAGGPPKYPTLYGADGKPIMYN